jgi:hypothetical protein
MKARVEASRSTIPWIFAVDTDTRDCLLLISKAIRYQILRIICGLGIKGERQPEKGGRLKCRAIVVDLAVSYESASTVAEATMD